MNESDVPAGSPRAQLEGAVKDLWTMLIEAGDDFAVLMDRRRMHARVQRGRDGLYQVYWEDEDGRWEQFEGEFDNPREAVFHAYQGPH